MSEERNNTAITKLLNSQDNGINEVPPTDGGILAKLFRRFLMVGNITHMQWSEFLNSYVKLIESGQAGIRPNMVSIRGNTTKFLARDEFTWKNFIRAMRFLQTRRLKITIEREDFSGRVYTVEETVYFRRLTAADKFDDNKEN